MNPQTQTKGRPGCVLCGRKDVFRRPRSGKYHFRHKCPHGKWCDSGQPLRGQHGNSSLSCYPCANLNRAEYALLHRGKLDPMITRGVIAGGEFTYEQRILSAAEMMAALFEFRTRLVGHGKRL